MYGKHCYIAVSYTHLDVYKRQQIDSLQKQMMTLIEESTRLEDTDEEFDRQYREIEDQIKELK